MICLDNFIIPLTNQMQTKIKRNLVPRVFSRARGSLLALASHWHFKVISFPLIGCWDNICFLRLELLCTRPGEDKANKMNPS